MRFPYVQHGHRHGPFGSDPTQGGGIIYAYAASLNTSIPSGGNTIFDFHNAADYFQQSAGGPFSLDSDGVNVGLGSTLAGTYQVMTGCVVHDLTGHRITNSYSVSVSGDLDGSGWILARPQFGPFNVNGALRSGNVDSHWDPAQTSIMVVEAGGSGAGPLVVNVTNNTGETLSGSGFAYALYLGDSVAGV